MRLWLAKAVRGARVGLVPTDEESTTALRKLGDGECVEVQIIQPRSLQWHRLYFGKCRQIGENQDPQRDEDSIDMELRVLSGHYDVMYVGDHEVRVPKRIAFNKMTAEQWADYWKRAEQAISERFGPEYIMDLVA